MPVQEQTTEKEKEYIELLQRMQADFINYKRRVEAEREEQAKFAKADLILKLLPLLDDFRRMRETMPQAVAGSDWAQGIKLIERKLSTLLEKDGISRIEAEAKDFDPREHDAVSYEESDEYEEGKVKAVITDGYKLNGRVLRPAQVAVSKGRTRKSEDAIPASSQGRRRIFPMYYGE